MTNLPFLLWRRFVSSRCLMVKTFFSVIHEFTLLFLFLSFPFLYVFWSLTHCEPSDADNDVEASLLTTGVFECPHAVAVDVPVSARSRVHTALADLAGVSGGGFVDNALLDNGAVYGESVGWWSCRGRLFRSCGNDERFEYGVLQNFLNALISIFFLFFSILLASFLAKAKTYNDGRVPCCDLCVVVA